MERSHTVAPAEVSVLVEAVSRLDESLHPAGHGASPAMVPLRGRPVIQGTVEYLRGLGFRHFVIAMRRDDTRLFRFAASAFGGLDDVEVLRVDAEDDAAALPELLGRARGPHALVVPGGVHFRLPTSVGLDRGDVFVVRGGPGESSGAVYRVTDVARLREALAADDPPALDAAVALSEGEEPRCVEAGEWIDCSRFDHLERAASRTSQARAFNRIAVDATLSTITKTSEHREKLRDEIAYYAQLPAELSVLFPRVIRSDACGERPFLELEYYGYPTLAQLLVYESMNPRLWRRVLEHVMAVHDAMVDFRREPDPAAARSIYVDKVEARVERLAHTSAPCRALLESEAPVVINGAPCRSFSSSWPRMRERLDAVAADGSMTVIHGDLCFSNVLYDVGEGICRLIDPRGSFGQRGIWGDPRYDAAKLRHSSHGLYDFIVADLFEVSRDADGWRLDIHAHPSVREVDAILDALIRRRHDPADVLAIEGALFLSMGVLHGDHPTRQIAMTLRGLEIWEEMARLEAPAGAVR